MSDEVVTAATDQPVVETPQDTRPAQEPATTAAPEPGTQPEGDPETPEERRFTQAELDAEIGKRLARERRKFEREQRTVQATPPVPTGEITPEQFPTDEAYQDAVVQRRAAEMVATRDAQREQLAIEDAYHDRREKALERYPDYAMVVEMNDQLAVTPLMGQVIKASDVGPEIAYYLGTNPEESRRIAQLQPFLQAKEIGRIEAKVLAEPPTRKLSSAPPPITPVRVPGGKTRSLDTTDPRAAEELSMDEWAAKENERQRKRLEARVH